MSHFPAALFLGYLLLIQLAVSAQQPFLSWEQSVPEVSTFSSPRATDLNGDGVRDIVIGAGMEDVGKAAGIFAFDGASGTKLWQRYARNQMYGSPLFQDITQDGVPDVFITGRDAQFYALNGVNGTLIWEFWPDTNGPAVDSGWYNFYLPQWIPDQDGDGYRDLIVTNGGDSRLAPAEKNRPTGYLMALSSIDGNILQMDTMPDGKETYHSPLVVDFLQNGDWQLLFGSGGETVGGSYWRVSLADFMNRGLADVQMLLSNSTEGYIAVPAIADLNHDGIPDIIVPQLNANIIALDGLTGVELWRHTEPGTDCYVSPAIGQFTGDNTPDVFVLAATGNWPFYQQSIKLLIDGSNGQVVWSEVGYPFQMTSGIALDWDGDGYDEVIYPQNQDIGTQSRHLVHQLFLYDFNDNQITAFDVQRPGAMVFSMPLLTDLENDQSLELIFATHDNTRHWYQPDGFTLHRLNLNFYQQPVPWGGYQGSGGDGIYSINLQVSVNDPPSGPLLRAYPNPVNHTLYFHTLADQPIDRIELFDAWGRAVLRSEHSAEISVETLSAGIYFYQVQVGGQMVSGRVVKG